MNRNELVIFAAAVTTLIAVTSLAAYANGLMQYWTPNNQLNQGYSPAGGMMSGGMMSSRGMMGDYSNRNYQQAPTPQQTQQYYGQGMMGGGMKGGYPNQYTRGTANQSLPYCGAGGMLGAVGMMGGGSMMGGYFQSVPTALAHAEAEQIGNSFLASLNNSSLTIGDFDEYSSNFYLSIVDKSTGSGVLEVLIDRFTGSVYPEPQSMMWNKKYGGMMGNYLGSGSMTVTSDQAKKIAQEFLNVTYPGTTVGGVDTFPGYYTIETTLNGQTYGMLSINGYTGAIWYHTWHGEFISALK